MQFFTLEIFPPDCTIAISDMVVALIIGSRLNWQNQFQTLHHSPRRPPPASSDVTTDFFSLVSVFPLAGILCHVLWQHARS